MKLATSLIILMSILLWHAPTSFSATPKIPWKNEGRFDPSRQLISFEPNRTGLFRFGEKNRIITSDESEIYIYTIQGGKTEEVYRGKPLERVWSPGYYFVENSSDRAAFCVLPPRYEGAPNLGADADVTAKGFQQNFRTAGFGWTRMFWNFTAATTNTWYDWGPFDVWERRDQKWVKTDLRGSYRPGQWNFGHLKRTLEWAEANDLDIFLQIDGFPSWIPEGNTGEKSPQHFAAWCDDLLEFVSQQGAARRIKAVSVPYNEPFYRAPFLKAIPDYRQPQLYGWQNDWSGTYNDWLAQAAYLVASKVRLRLPWASVAGGNHMDFGHARESFGAMRASGLDMSIFDSLNHHVYMGLATSDETVFYDLKLRQDYESLLSLLPRANRIYLDEYAVGWSRRSEGDDLVDVLGVPYAKSEHMSAQLNGVPYADWWAKANDIIKEACILKKYDAVVIGHQVCRGSGNAVEFNRTYDGWFSGANGNLRGPRYSTAVWLLANHWLKGATFHGREETDHLIVLYTFITSDKRKLVFTWTKRGTIVPFATPSGFRAMDIFGRPLGLAELSGEPIILLEETSPDQ